MKHVWFITSEGPHDDEQWEPGLSLCGLYDSLAAALQDFALQQVNEETFAQLLWRQSDSNQDHYEIFGPYGSPCFIIGRHPIQRFDLEQPSIAIPPQRLAQGYKAFLDLWNRLVGDAEKRGGA